MKVSIGMHIQEGPFGGANQFAKSLCDYLSAQGHQVCFDLEGDDIDIILLTDPRPEMPSNAFTIKEIVRYLRKINPRALVVHRINECDERKNTNYMNKVLVDANRACADHTVFIASWLKDLFAALGIPPQQSSVLLNGADTSIFNADGYRKWRPIQKLRLVTHHWGANWNKGFDVYAKIDEMLESEPYRSSIFFTYIGNLPKGVRLKNTRCLDPLSGRALANKIKRSHVYITGTINEPAGMHHIEGALCGLPLIFRNSGALPEYCGGHGIMFNDVNDFPQALDRMMQEYESYADRMPTYSHTSAVMCQKYVELFAMLLGKRESIIKQRKNKCV
jgi:hypothetical protein